MRKLLFREVGLSLGHRGLPGPWDHHSLQDGHKPLWYTCEGIKPLPIALQKGENMGEESI